MQQTSTSYDAARPRNKSALMQLETQILPLLIKKVGDEKSGRLSYPMVHDYINRHRLIFNDQLLQSMFHEADHRREGSLTAKDVLANLDGRYHKRQHGQHWRELVAMLLGMPDLDLSHTEHLMVAERLSTSRYTKARPTTQGTYNSDSFWDSPPPTLPAKSTKRSAHPHLTMSDPSPRWTATADRSPNFLEASMQLPGPHNGTSPCLLETKGRLRAAGAVAEAAGQLHATSRVGNTPSFLLECSAGQLPTTSSLRPALVDTVDGLRTAVPTAAEMEINAKMLLDGSGQPSCTFDCAWQFKQLTGSMEARQQLDIMCSGSAAGPIGRPSITPASCPYSPGSTRQLAAPGVTSSSVDSAAWGQLTAGSRGVPALESTQQGSLMLRRSMPRKAVVAWKATLPPSAIGFSASALSTLRSSIKSAGAERRLDFDCMHYPLRPHDMTLKSTLGQPMALEASNMNRVEPVRPTKILQQDDYVTWSDLASRCPTSPTRWYERHPSSLAALHAGTGSDLIV